MWNKTEPAPADAILGLTEAFKRDIRPEKVNLGVGIYKDETGATPVLAAVKAAEKKLFEAETTKSYMPIAGDATYGIEVQKMILGNTSNRAATLHTPGGTGALRLAGELLNEFGNNTIWVSNPTWANHKNIFKAAGLTVQTYAYYNAETKTLDEQAFFQALENIPTGDAVLLHACCHNPTGVDLNAEQWDRVAALSETKGWTALIDFAYQGFGESIEADRKSVETFLETGSDFLVASSFSKNFGLYRERTGALTAIAATPEAAQIAGSHMKKHARVMHSNPPAHGGLIVTTLLSDPELSNLWKNELNAMRERIARMRNELAHGLTSRGIAMDSSFITQQNGMFSFSGLNKRQVDFLREEKAIYIVGSGRINIAGLTPSNMNAICDGIAEAVNLQTTT